MNTDLMLKTAIEEFRKKATGEIFWYCKNGSNDNVHSLKLLVGNVLTKIGEETDGNGMCNLAMLIEGEVVDWRMSSNGSRLVEQYKVTDHSSPHYGNIKKRDIGTWNQNMLFGELVMTCILMIGKNIALNSYKKSEQIRLRKSGVKIGG